VFLYFKAMTDSISEQKISVVIRKHRVRISGYAAARPAGWFRFLLNHPDYSSFRVVDLIGIPLNENRCPAHFAGRSAASRVSRLKFENHVFVHFYLLWFVRTPNRRGSDQPNKPSFSFVLVSAEFFQFSDKILQIVNGITVISGETVTTAFALDPAHISAIRRRHFIVIKTVSGIFEAEG